MDCKTFLRELLLKRLRIAVKDGRVIDGHFMCTDNECNIVLSNCEEFLTQEDVDKTDKKVKDDSINVRTLSLAIVPGNAILSINVQDNSLTPELKEYIIDEQKSIKIEIKIEQKENS